MREKHRRKIMLPVLSILFPCVLGIMGMISQNVSVAIWIQNPLAIFLLAFACVYVSQCNLKFADGVIVTVSGFLLALTFLGPNVEEVHRWLRLPCFTLNIATIVIPMTIVAFSRLIEEEKVAFSVVGIMVIAWLLCVQPDASQLLAFSLPMAVLLLKSRFSKPIKTGIIAMLFLLTIQSWLCLDSLEPVNYSEGILAMLRDLSPALYVLGIVALLGMPVCVLLSSAKKNRNQWFGIALYYGLMIISSFMGNFPVPFMGYGISPILGFYLVLMRLQGETDA